jgi:hypothetical protein
MSPTKRNLLVSLDRALVGEPEREDQGPSGHVNAVARGELARRLLGAGRKISPDRDAVAELVAERVTEG